MGGRATGGLFAALACLLVLVACNQGEAQMEKPLVGDDVDDRLSATTPVSPSTEAARPAVAPPSAELPRGSSRRNKDQRPSGEQTPAVSSTVAPLVEQEITIPHVMLPDREPVTREEPDCGVTGVDCSDGSPNADVPPPDDGSVPPTAPDNPSLNTPSTPAPQE